MNPVRERVLLDASASLRNYPYNEHRDLISFCVGSEYFEDYEETNQGICADFNEVVAVVDKNWLFNEIRKYEDGIEPRKYLQEEYTTEDSGDWFDTAVNTNHLMMVSFN